MEIKHRDAVGNCSYYSCLCHSSLIPLDTRVHLQPVYRNCFTDISLVLLLLTYKGLRFSRLDLFGPQFNKGFSSLKIHLSVGMKMLWKERLLTDLV